MSAGRGRGRSVGVWAVAVLSWLAVAAAPATARPAKPAPMLAFEAGVGERSPEVRALLDVLADSLETHGFVTRRAGFEQLLGGRLPLPGRVDAKVTADDIAQQVTAGIHAYVRGNFEDALAKLQAVIDQIHRNPEVLVIDTQNTELAVRAHMALALSQDRLGQAGASSTTLMELVRITRGQPISRSEFGPEADKMYRAVLRHAQSLGRGSLTIATGDERAMIFVDGSLRGMGKATLGDLFPGAYRVYVQAPNESGRRYTIEVQADEDHVLGVKYELEKSLWITESSVGFRFANDVERKDEVRYATELARIWAGEGMFAVVGDGELQGKAVLAGTLYRTDGSVVRSATIETAGADHHRVRSLARFLADGTPGDGIEVRDVDVDVARAPKAGVSSTLAPKLVVLGGILALGAGATLYALDEDPDPSGVQRPTYRDTAPGGVVLGAAGLAVAGAGVVWWLHRAGRSAEASRPAVSVRRTGASFGWAFAF